MTEGAITANEIRTAVRAGNALKPTPESAGLGRVDANTLEEAVRGLGEEARSLRLDGTLITGQLDLSQLVLPAGLELVNCRVPNGLSIAGSTLSGLRLKDTEIGPVDAHAVSVRAPVELLHVSLNEHDGARGALNLRNATVGGLNIRNSFLDALDLSTSTIAGQVNLVESHIKGVTSLVDTTISGHLWFRSCRFTADSDPWVIYSRGLRVRGSLRFLAECKANAAVIFHETTIDGTVDIYGGQFGHSGGQGFSIDDSRIGGSVVIRPAWEVESGPTARNDLERANKLVSTYADKIAMLPANGHTIVLDPRITYFDGPLFNGPLELERVSIGGDVSIARCTTASGNEGSSLILRGSTIEGKLHIIGAHCHRGGVDLSATKVRDSSILDLASVEGPVHLTGVHVAGIAKVNCRNVRGPLVLDQLHAAAIDVRPAQLVAVDASVDGMVLGRIQYHDSPMADVKKWISALDRLEGGAAGYEAVASAMDSHGQSDLATRVRIAHQRRAKPQHRGARISHWLYGAFLGYGYRPGRMILVILGLIGAIAMLTMLPFAGTALVTTTDDGSKSKNSPCSTEFHCFSTVPFAIDTVTPLVDLDQRDHWYADRSAPWGRELDYALGAGKIAGWAATTIFVVALSRAAK